MCGKGKGAWGWHMPGLRQGGQPQELVFQVRLTCLRTYTAGNETQPSHCDELTSQLSLFTVKITAIEDMRNKGEVGADEQMRRPSQ